MDLIEGSDDSSSSSDDEERIHVNHNKHHHHHHHVLITHTTQDPSSSADAAAATTTSSSSSSSSLKKRRIERISSHSHEAVSALFVRTTPHIRGNWAGHVFCQVQVSRSSESSVLIFQRALEQVGWSGTLVTHDDLHISLSRPFVLQEANINSFVHEIRQELMGVPATTLHVTNHIVLVNENSTRSFWCWALSTNPTMIRIIASIDLILAKYHQPPYYHPPTFHVSLASIPGLVPSQCSWTTNQNTSSKCVSNCYNEDDSPPSESDSDDEETDSNNTVRVDHVLCTFGNTKRFSIQLY